MVAIIVLSMAMSGQAIGGAVMTAPLGGMWAARAASLWPGSTAIADHPSAGRLIDIPSPDASLVLHVEDESISLRTAGGRRIGRPVKVEDLAEVLWAPDSRALALTHSDGGWVGSWHVVVYEVTTAGLRPRDTAAAAFREFSGRKVERHGECEVEQPNMAAVSWVGGSKQLLVVAEAPPHSSCCDMGSVRGYLLELATGAIVRRYSPSALRREFGQTLGPRVSEGTE